MTAHYAEFPMQQPDPRIAPLAAALQSAIVPEYDPIRMSDGYAREYAAAILAALPPDWCGHASPPEGTRLILATIDVLPKWGTRTEDGRALAAEWGEPDEHGWYSPTFTASGLAEITRLRKIEKAAEALIVLYPPDWIETKGSPALRALQKAVHG